MSRLALFLLGPPRIELDGEAVHIGRKKALALLAYLAVTPGNHPRDKLATLLWPDYDQSSARAHLRRGLVSLTNRLGSEWFVADRESIGLNPAEGLWLDVDQFRQRLTACEADAHAASDDCLALLTEAVELYRDDLMAGFSLPDSLPFDEWQRSQTESLLDELACALERLADGQSTRGDLEPAIVSARRWLELDPLNEQAHRLLMRLFAQADRSGAALRQYRSCMRVLDQELGVPPAAETTALYERLRAERLVQGEESAPTPPPTDRTIALPAFLDGDAAPIRVKRPLFVARENELVWLDDCLQAALAGQGKVVFIIGGPGRGKTALMNQFARQALAAHSDLLAVRGTCNAYSGAGDPYLPFRELMSALTGDVEAAWASGTISQDHARRLWASIPLAAQALLDHGPYLINALLSGAALLARAAAAADDSPAWLRELSVWAERERAGQADVPQRAIFEQFTNVLRALAERHPLLLTLDDLQWADSGSISLLFHLGRRLADGGGRVMIVGAYRPEEVSAGRNEERHPLEPVLDELQRRFGDVWVDLAQADDAEGRRFIDAYLDTESNRLGEGFRSALFQHTAGHPLFTVELLRAMQARGDLVQDASTGGVWVEGPALDWEALPARVEAVIKARVGRLDEKQYDTLSVASVEGERFTAQIIARVLEIPEREMLRMLSQPLGPDGHRLVREEGDVHVIGTGRFLSRYRFAHAVFQEYLYHTLSAGERRLLHGEIAMALEETYADQSDEIAAELAHHYVEAGRRQKAIEYALRAGHQARLTYANQEAITFYARALKLLPPLDLQASPPLGGKEGAARRLEALKGLGQVNFALGDPVAAEAHIKEAIALGQEIDLASRDLVRLYHWLLEALYAQGRYEEEITFAEQGLTLLGDDVNSVEAALMNHHLGGGHNAIGKIEFSVQFRARCAQIVRHLPYAEELMPVYWSIIIYYEDDLKNVQEAEQWLQIPQQHAKRHHDMRALAETYMHAGIILVNQGDYREGIRQLQKGLELSKKIGDARGTLWNHYNLGFAALTLGDLYALQEHADRMLETAQSAAQKMFTETAYRFIGVLHLCHGAMEKAVDAFQKAAVGHFFGSKVWGRIELGQLID